MKNIQYCPRRFYFADYYAIVHFSAEDDVFFGKIIGINDVVSFEGTTVAQLKKAFHEAVDDYLETCVALGKEPEKLYKGSFNVRIPSELHRQAALQATRKKMSLNDFVRFAIDFTLSKTEDSQSVKLMLFCIIIIAPALVAVFS